MHYRPEVLDVIPSPLLAIGALAESMPGAIKLCYGESDLSTPEFISRAAYDAALAGHTYYTTTAGYIELRQAIADKIQALHGIEYRPTEIMSTVGASMGIFTAIRALVGPGDNAVVVSPAYSIFTNAVILAGAEPRSVPLVRSADCYVLDVDRVRRAVDARTRLLVVNSPSNPTGWIVGDEEQRALVALAVEHDLLILSDEVYERIVYDRRVARSFACAAREAGERDRVIVVNSFSKTYNMTGWRLGWVQASERTIRLMAGAAEFMTSNAASMVQQAGIVACAMASRSSMSCARTTRRVASRRCAPLPRCPGLH
ncbi:MAG TPA: pyridoxal phosphate-dependent aminotransferase [Gemmatimonadaceae bacterium]|nr:pyridoxal phosphate-dependent aminotransferase [Gemmatimonadaceae bacterium]